MAGWLIVVILGAPLLAVVASLLLGRARAAEYLNLAAASAVFLATLALPAAIRADPRFYLDHYLILDAAGAWVLLVTACIYLLASIYATGYMRLTGEDERLYRFYALFAGFAWTMLLAPLMNNIGLYWIAVELTTLVSTFLVGFERGVESIEAAWKYIIVVSAGISLALLGTLLFYWGGSLVVGPSYNLTWTVLLQIAPRIHPTLFILAFLLVLTGYGTKVGLAPMHTWLPDAHSEGPAPVSAMLSGALLNTAMLGIARFVAAADAAHAAPLPRTVLVALGAFSLFVAALFIVRQEGVKRLMAYSSVEHMGVLALGFGFGGPLGVAGAFYHMLNHSLNKSLMFFGAGAVMRSYGTKDMGAIRGLIKRMPAVGLLWLAGAVAITGAPPFGLFLSEVAIMRAGFASAHSWAVWIMGALLIVIFIGFLNHFRRMLFSDAQEAPPQRVQGGPWCLIPMALALAPVFVLGLWWPEGLMDYFSAAARALAGATP